MSAPVHRRIAIIQGHPDGAGGHYCHALAAAYAAGAREAGHDVTTVDIGRMSFPLLRGRDDQRRETPPEITAVQRVLALADHVVLVFPVWNGGMPALTRGFFEQAFRPSFVFPDARPGEPLRLSSYFRNRKGLAGKTGRIIATMQMPGFMYRLGFHPRGERNAFKVAGVSPVRETFVGTVESAPPERRAAWLARVRALGRAGR
jgi:putative NADPH-quinone reductase